MSNLLMSYDVIVALFILAVVLIIWGDIVSAWLDGKDYTNEDEQISSKFIKDFTEPRTLKECLKNKKKGR